jgi:serine/threonine protein kinase/formylglycine-generating enzyme required for sulfatase activity
MLSLRDDPLLKDIPEVDGFKVLEPCVLYSKLGEGGMGAVYRGRHLNLDIDVAVKCMRSVLADQSAAFVQRFQREARLAAGIHHQNLVQVYDVSQKSGVHYLVMEFVHGETARDRVKRKGALGLGEALRIALGAATGLGEAHGRKIVHRDVKPDNVLIGRDGSVKVSDLGLAKAIESEVDVSLTQGVMGTPQYMAPEQWEDSSSVTPAADVWALGATIWFLLAGSDPIKKGTMQQVYRAICVESFPDVRSVRPDVPEAVAKLIARCVARTAAERFADCREVAAELRHHVGIDQGELITHEGEATTMGATMVSPPPPATMARIRSQVGSKGWMPEAEGPAATLPLEPPATARADVPATHSTHSSHSTGTAPPGPRPPTALAGGSAPGKRKLLWIGGGALALVVIAGLIFKNASGGKPQPGPFLPQAGGEVLVRLDQVSDFSEGYASSSRRFTMGGGFTGKEGSLRPKIRERGGRVKLEPEGKNRFRLEFDFDADGKYTLLLEAPDLEGDRELPLIVDATKPILMDSKSDPRRPLPRDASVTLTLEFNEELLSAEIDGRRADVNRRSAEITARSPSNGSTWTVPWKAVDLLGNESVNKSSFDLAPLPKDPEVVKRDDAPQLPDGPDAGASGSRPDTSGRSTRLVESESEKLPPPKPPVRGGQGGQAPAGTRALGDETLDVKGVARPRRVEHVASGIKMVLIPPGSFTMGGGFSGDTALAPRKITISRGFYMAEDELSEAEYARALKEAGPTGSERLPKEDLSFDLATKFCKAAGLELPTEAEWEYACRAGSTGVFFFGDDLSPRQAATQKSPGARQPCGFSERNAWGLSDMHGNLREICADGYATPAEYAKLEEVDPVGKRNREAVLRGGSYMSIPKNCASAARVRIDRTRKTLDTGVRPILRLP